MNIQTALGRRKVPTSASRDFTTVTKWENYSRLSFLASCNQWALKSGSGKVSQRNVISEKQTRNIVDS